MSRERNEVRGARRQGLQMILGVILNVEMRRSSAAHAQMGCSVRVVGTFVGVRNGRD